MLTKTQIIKHAQEVLRAESQAIDALIPSIGQDFIDSVELICKTKGRVIATGMGKPGYIAHKLSATLMSTGTPSIYLHPAEAIHGDLGMITPSDVVIAISNSGETAEITNILPTIKKIGVPLIAICGNPNSTLGKNATYYLDAHISKEICPLNLAPTTSTTVQLALGDALAIVIMTIKKFTAKDFAFYHPGGSLGQIRLLTVKKLLEQTNKNPLILLNNLVSDALFTMTEAGIGAVSVVDENKKLCGIVTDGDIRRHLKNSPNLLNENVSHVMTKKPITINEHQLILEALALMENHLPNPVTVLPVINDANKVTGMIHITDLFKLKNINK